jgi:hypothetical protein
MNEMNYCNEVLVRLEELLFHELSGCAAWKTELVGVDFIQSKNIQGTTPDEIIQNCIKEIKDAGFVEEMTYEIGGRGVKLELRIKGCVHLPKEQRLREDGVKPYICPLTNMILDQLIEKLNYTTTYIGEMKIDETTGECRTRSSIFETPEMIGTVSNWDEE